MFQKQGGQLRLSEALARGFSRYQFYQLRDEGLIEPVSRGLYRLADLPPIENPDLVAAATRFPSAVLCLISALDWHGITTQIPHQVHLAVARDARLPVLDYPPVAGYRFSGLAFSAGIEQVDVDGITLNVYNPEKTLADCFKFRNRIGMDVVLEALELYRIRKTFLPGKLMEYARICRVATVMAPYVEAKL
ncbi:type IV toxin-antitoxin system AbiEi family antitoxin domain-containing protein [Marinobacter hydrocarbonoclasticus]|uniref:Transcriptional regulator n=1 Tax=Marinobacter nauticus TaxID=2743 RepID=A0A3D3WL36_MARNT|nr:transcriptional regulator [Marinobacter sp.]MBW3197834.1 type IV toxin-antitoxin system AbiEi family antitoxin domain-containing protein [Marinobacter nauticus]MAP31399.1 transcriptional regulator [Marinobacter sp.]MBY6183244.1 type IV toxin-antitoxin system AbiEi family antitoxin domain-containing protein [Marinobacter nauticus]HAC28344.1 transcriptional regulator [Marinobacter nauticus]